MKNLISLFCMLIGAASFFSQTNLEIGLYNSQNIGKMVESHFNTKDNLEPIGYSVGLMSNFEVKQKKDIVLGLFYNKMNLNSSTNGRLYKCLYCSLGLLDMQSENIELLTALRFRFSEDKKITPFASLGFTQFIKLRTLIKGDSGLDSKIELEDFVMNNWGYNVAIFTSLGVKYKLSELINFDFESSLRTFPVRNTNFRNNMALGLGLTLNYRLASKKI